MILPHSRVLLSGPQVSAQDYISDTPQRKNKKKWAETAAGRTLVRHKVELPSCGNCNKHLGGWRKWSYGISSPEQREEQDEQSSAGLGCRSTDTMNFGSHSQALGSRAALRARDLVRKERRGQLLGPPGIGVGVGEGGERG